jgi:hypothetical protein
MVAVTEKLLAIVCPRCGERDLVPFAANGQVGRCNACKGTFVIQGEIVPVGFSFAIDPATGKRPVAAAPKNQRRRVRAPAPEPAKPCDESAPAPQPPAAANRHEQQPKRSLMRRAALYVGVPVLILVLLIVGRGFVAPSDDAAPQASATSGTWNFPLSESDNGYAWNRADYAKRIALCESFARNNMGQPGQRARDAKYFYEAIHSFYNSNPQAPILQLEISKPAKLAVLTDGAK